MDVSADGTRTLTGDFNGSVRICDARTGELLHELRLGSRVWAVTFNPDGTRFAVAGSDKQVRVFDTSDWSPRLVIAWHQSSVAAVVFSRDGTLLATGSHDNMVRVWDAATGEPVSDAMPHQGPIWYPVTLAFSPDGRTVVAGCDDRTVRVWDVATAKPVGPVLRHDAGVRMVAFAGNTQVRTGTTTGVVRLWHATLSPLEGDVERITLWLQVATGLELDAEGSLNALDSAQWKERRTRLRALGGAPTGG